MDNEQFDKIFPILEKSTRKFGLPVVTELMNRTQSPYQVLISCLLSLRTKDQVTEKASKKLFSIADNPSDMIKLSTSDLEKIIYPVGFFRNKAKQILEISKILIEKHDNKVPDDLEELLKFKGVGRKTANLVVTVGYGKPGICVDTHVHRISNRIGYVKTKTPEETEMALRKKLPKKYWLDINNILVTYGQNICKPIKPLCDKCKIRLYCDSGNYKQ